jgi:hypothetical protein
MELKDKVAIVTGGVLTGYGEDLRSVRRLRIMVGFALCYFALLFVAFHLPAGNPQLLAIAAAFLTGSGFVGASGVIVTRRSILRQRRPWCLIPLHARLTSK